MDKRFGKPRPSGDNDQGSNITPADLLSLPPAQRKVMRMVMRHAELSYPALCEVLDQLPEPEHISRPELDTILEALVNQHWLIQIGDKQTAIYRLGKIQKADPATLPSDPTQPSRRRSGLDRLNGLWGKLADRLEPEKHTPRPAGGHPADEASGQQPAGDTGYVSSMFKELARNPSASPAEAQAHPEPKDIKPAGGGRISRMFEEMSAKPAPDEESDDHEA